MAKKIILEAFKIDQLSNSKKNIFMSKLKVSDLINETQFQIDFWEPEKKNTENQGYQRKPSKSRYTKVAKYVIDGIDPIFPTTILLNSRDPLKFTPEDKKQNRGKLVLNEYPLRIIDGQHRIEGLKYAIKELGEDRCKRMELPVVILSNFKTIEEANQFYVLNTTQRKVATDLAQRLISDIVKKNPKEFDKLVDRSADWEIRVLPVIDLLNEKPNNPWTGRIKLPNSSKSASNIINQTSFVRSLKPLFKDGLFSVVKNVDESYEILRNYWIAIKRIFPEAFSVPKEYVIQKTPGVFSLHELAHKILLKKGESCKTELDFLNILNKVFSSLEIDSDFWRADGDDAALYGSMKGFRILADKFTSVIKN